MKTTVVERIFYLLILLFASYFTYLFHEFGHWITGVLQGYDMHYSLNGVWPVESQIVEIPHQLLGLIAGPAFTIIQSIICAFLIIKTKSKFFYPFLLFPFVSRLFSLIFGGFSNQDEAKIALILDINEILIVSISVISLYILVLFSSIKLKKKDT